MSERWCLHTSKGEKAISHHWFQSKGTSRPSRRSACQTTVASSSFFSPSYTHRPFSNKLPHTRNDLLSHITNQCVRQLARMSKQRNSSTHPRNVVFAKLDSRPENDDGSDRFSNRCVAIAVISAALSPSMLPSVPKEPACAECVCVRCSS